MAANDVYINPGTEITFQSSGGTVTMTVDNNCSFQDGVKSAACTLATNYTDARPDEYKWTCKAFWAAGAVVGETLDIYAAEANADGEYAGGVSAGDGAFTDEDALSNMTYVGSVVVTNATEEQEYADGVVRLTSNKLVLVAWNDSAAATMHATATNFEFKLLPIPAQGQA
jgi:hypothetical protein